MPEKVTIREDLQIIQIDSYGDVSIEDLKQSLETVAKIWNERGLSKVLVNASNEESIPSTFNIFKFGSELAEMVRDLKFAVVRSPKLKDDLGFLETVTRNRGVKVKTFDSTEAALDWLI